MTSSSRTNNFLRPIRSTPIISGATGQVSYQQHDLWNFRESSVSSREGTPSSLRGIPSFDDLPDRAISTRKLANQKSSASISQMAIDAIKEAAYVGSFPVDEPTQEARAEYIKKHLTEKLNVKIAKPVLLAISLSGIKVCCGSGETVFMAHALKRISYATCQPEKCQFSFLAREPRAPTSIQYCHTFLTRSSSEAEELNNIVANAFKTAYIRQQQQNQTSSETSHAPSLSFNDLIQSQIDRQNQEFNLVNERKQEHLRNQLNRISTPRIDSLAQQRKERRSSGKKNQDEDSTEDSSKEEAVLAWARNAVEGLLSSPSKSKSHHLSNQKAVFNLSSSNDRISSLSEVSQLCGIRDDLSVIDDFLFGLSDQPGSPVSAIKEFVERNFVTLFGGELAPITSTMTLTLPPLHCRLALPEDLSPLDMEDQLSATTFTTDENKRFDFGSIPMESSLEPQRRYDREDEDGDDELEREGDGDLKEKNQISRERAVVSISNNVENLSREYFSKNGKAEDLSDANLSEAPWYQPGIPRDIALNKLLHQVNGTFVVRDSSTHPGCYALSIKVPKYDSPNEITHYLIVKTQRGTFKIKGLTKEWSSLTSLVLHHTIMRELLPCLLVLPTKQ